MFSIECLDIDLMFKLLYDLNINDESNKWGRGNL
jgi:hypothetical protein